MSSDNLRRVLSFDAQDNVANALEALAIGDYVEVDGRRIRVRSQIPLGHKIAVRAIDCGEPVIKYGERIGRSRISIQPGEHVHIHNVESLFASWSQESPCKERQ